MFYAPFPELAHNELSVPLTSLINNCIRCEIFPNNMKCAELNPVFKKDDNLNKENYRPVSVLTSISKVFESVLNDQLNVYRIRA